METTVSTKTAHIERFVGAIADTTARFQQGMIVRATWKTHVNALLANAERFGVRAQVEAKTRTMRNKA
jgi:hypothetical protein